VRPVHVMKRPKKRKKRNTKKNVAVANWVFARTTHVIGSKSNFARKVVFVG